MTKNLSIVGILLLLMTFSSCVKDGVDECPTGQVRLNFYAERFRNRFEDPLADREDKFCAVVNHLRYFLYKDGALFRQEIIPNFDDKDINCYTLSLNDLEYGDYQIVVVGNSTGIALTGDPVNPANLRIGYPGFADTEDYFTTSYPFSVSSPETKSYDVGMSRVHGVVRYSFRNMPADVSNFSVAMENVSMSKWVIGEYEEIGRAFNTFVFSSPTTRQASPNEEYVIGTFPTLSDQRSAYHLSLFRQGETEPYITHLVGDTFNIRRNQLLDITTIFEDGNIRFEVNMDSDWDGSLPNPGTELD